ncbi:SMI1/KNR4 family protein [Allosaccharopolyspora coralli]|uniref:SMI1/KNR4 family protein n=1 Tax=Allosaccharopolyspora coralli TaxID=2665642 RepID=A0A5Q3QBY2_9PSEU|nr:SMI1/KNR4 family protein [Allosaccharopolyspora coralli]QGK71380.1 SMI1/KNR4 family protein [Allosaccharopolyspora coralli]
MEVVEVWSDIVRWLDEYAPVTAASLRVPDPALDVARLVEEFALTLPADLMAWWECCDGTDDDVLADVLPPFYTPYGARRSLEAWRCHRRSWAERDEPNGFGRAGSEATGFHPAWVPIAGDGFADELVVDLRPGPSAGCVLEWEQETSQTARPEWADVSAMLSDVRRALVEGTSAGHSHPTVTEDGRLDWQVC